MHSPETRTLRASIRICIIAWLLAPGILAQGLPITVDNPLTIPRTAEPVASGIAIPWYYPVHEPNDLLTLVDDTGAAVPVQFKVLSRWFGTRDDVSKSAKWILVEFLADVPAAGSSTYYLRSGTRATGQVADIDSSTHLVVATGAATFTFDKDEFGLEQVKVGGQIVTGAPGSLSVQGIGGAPVPVTVDETVVEEAGSVRTVVRQRGTLPALGLAFTSRFFFWTGRSDVRVDFRLENPGSYGLVPYTGDETTTHFESLALDVRLASGDGSVVRSAGPANSLGLPYVMIQSYGSPATPTDMLSGFWYFESVGPAPIGMGERHDGAIAVNGSFGSVSVAVDRCWQNFPKSFTHFGATLSVALWPSFGNGPGYGGQYAAQFDPNLDALADTYYRFEGGRWKTHTLDLDFRATTSAFGPAEVAAHAERVNHPLMAHAPAEWSFKHFAFGHVAVERRAWTEVSDQRYERLADVLAKDSAADWQATLGKIGLPKFRERGGTYGGRQHYGWANWGDLHWGDGLSSLHYDMPFGVLFNWFRTGDYAFYDVGRDLVAHRRDYDQDHSTHPSDLRRGGQFYEKGWYHGNYRFPTESHTWLHGLLVWYVMTGDEGAYEAAIECGDFLIRRNAAEWSGWWGSRLLGWPLEGVMNLFNYLGDFQYLQHAWDIVERWKELENQWGQLGYVPNPGTSNDHCQTWMHGIVYNALAKYYLATMDANVLGVMQRMADFFMNHAVATPPSGPAHDFMVGRVYTLARHDWQSDVSMHHNWVMTEALAHAALIFDDTSYYDMAEGLWEGMTRYHQRSSGDYTLVDLADPTGYSPVAFRMMQFPNSETKIMGNIGIWSHAFPAVRLLMNGNW